MENCTKCGNCSRCGNCCAIGIPITREEENTIRTYIKENSIKPESLYEDENFYAYCCFFDRKNKKCKIYNVRPLICRSYQCNRDIEELEKEKIENHNKAYWNHIGKDGKLRNFTTFDLLFYDDPKPILDLIFRSYHPINEEKYKRIIREMKEEWGLQELAGCITPSFEEENL